MPNPWRDKVLAYNKHRQEVDSKASDMDVIVAGLLKLPPGQLKKILTEDVLAVLAKYGYEEA